jgi:predicted DNA binding protein
MPRDDGGHRQADATECSLQVEFDVAPRPDCPLAALTDVREVHQRVTDDVCRTDVLVADESGTGHVTRLTTGIESGCLCPVFDAFGCVPQVLATGSGDSLRIRTFVADRDTLAGLVAALREVSDTVRLRRISETPTATAPRETVNVSLDTLTETQRETLRRAVEAGYFDTPRRTSLAELAAEFGVSKSAVSRRLQAAERHLVDELFVCED